MATVAKKKAAKKKVEANGSTSRVKAKIEEVVGKGKKSNKVTISRPAFEVAEFKIRGDSPYVQNAFSQKAFNMMKEAQEAGQTAKKGKKRDPKNFKECYEGSQHKSAEGWYGIPASSFRNAMVSACKIVGFHMTKAKLSCFVVADGMDRDGSTPLVRIRKGKPKHVEHPVRLEKGGTDIRARAMFDPGWEAVVRVKFDTEQFTLSDVANLMMRVGMQVGVGEGRPDSPKSCGMGWGTFELVG